MYHFSPRVCFTLTLVTASCFAAAGQVQAQAALASMSTTSRASNSISSQSSTGHDSVPNKLISAQVHDGVLVIDGMVAKVQLNYEVQHTGYMYFFVPGMGTAVVSLAPLADAVKVKDAFDGSKLTFAAGGHAFELTSKGNLLTKDRSKTDVYVRLDRSTVAVGRYPMMGFGNTTEPPYAWPLSGPAMKDRDAHFVAPPPLPPSVLPRTATATAAPVGSSPATRP
jgi:hypothetical protein